MNGHSQPRRDGEQPAPRSRVSLTAGLVGAGLLGVVIYGMVYWTVFRVEVDKGEVLVLGIEIIEDAVGLNNRGINRNFKIPGRSGGQVNAFDIVIVIPGIGRI